eukprot:401567_1
MTSLTVEHDSNINSESDIIEDVTTNEAQTLITTNSNSNYKHVKPLSPTPISDEHELIEPLKSPAILLPNAHAILTSNLSNKQFYKYVENIIINHITQSNKTINDEKLIPLHSITNTLHELKNLLVQENILFSEDSTLNT